MPKRVLTPAQARALAAAREKALEKMRTEGTEAQRAGGRKSVEVRRSRRASTTRPSRPPGGAVPGAAVPRIEGVPPPPPPPPPDTPAPVEDPPPATAPARPTLRGDLARLGGTLRRIVGR